MSDKLFITMSLGHINLDTRMRPVPGGLVGEARSMEYDMQGNLIRDTGWQPTGSVLHWNGVDPSLFLEIEESK